MLKRWFDPEVDLQVLQDMGASVSAEEEELLLQNFHKACSDSWAM